MSQITSPLCEPPGGEQEGKSFPKASPTPQLLQGKTWKGWREKLTFWGAKAMPTSANTQVSCSCSHLFNPSALRLVVSCWLRKHKPQAAFWSLSAALFCQAEAFLSSDTKCSLSFSPWELRTLPPAAAPAFVSPREQGGWRDARVSGRETAL